MSIKSILITLFMLLSIPLSASVDMNKEYKCSIKWVLSDGERQLPPKELSTVYVSFKDTDTVKFRTKNQSSYYVYQSFKNIQGKLGISFHADNGNDLLLFNDKDMFIGDSQRIIMAGRCPKMELDIGKVKK
jgi:hypothetical protein